MRLDAVLSTHLFRREWSRRRGEKKNAFMSVLLVRVLAFFLSPIIYLYRSGLSHRSRILYDIFYSNYEVNG